MRRTIGAAIVAVAFLVPAGSAHAGFLDFCSNSVNPYCFETELSYFDSNSQAPENNNVTLTRSGDTLVLTDTGAPIQADPSSGCTVAGNTATCPAPATARYTYIFIGLGGGNDTAVNNVGGSETPTDAPPFVDITISGAAGDDTITGADVRPNTNEELRGGTGNDTINGRAGHDFVTDYDFYESTPDPATPPMGGTNTLDGGAGNDSLQGGSGVDTLRGGDGDDFFTGDRFLSRFSPSGPILINTTANDTMDGGPGFDEVSYEDKLKARPDGSCCAETAPTDPGVTITLNDTSTRAATTTGNGYSGESDTLSSIEDATGTGGADNITGSAISNVIRGSNGNDKITGGLGPDQLFGNDGDDDIQAADGESDRVDCGGNAGDKAGIDQVDLTSNCPPVGQGTTVTQVANPNIPPADKNPPVFRGVKTPKKIKASVLKKRGYKFTVGTTETSPVRLMSTLTAKVRSVRISTAGEIILAEKRRTFSNRATITLKIAKKLHRSLRKGRKMRLLLQLSDQNGNTTSRRVNLRIT